MTVAIERDPIYRGRRFQSEIIELCVRWYLTYRLSYRDLVEMLAERGVVVSHTTIYRWVQQYVPEFERRWSRYAKAVDPSWRVDETAISVRGGLRYLYRAVDKFGKTVDSLLCADRSVSAARAFFCKAVKTHHPRPPQKVNLDGNAASHRALRLLRARESEFAIRGDPKLPVSQQHRRAGPSRHQAPLRTDARPQVISYRGRHARGRGTRASNPEGAVLIAPRRRDRTLFLQTSLGTCAEASRCPSAARSDEPRPPMQQNSNIRLQTDQDVRNIEPVRYPRKDHRWQRLVSFRDTERRAVAGTTNSTSRGQV